MPNILTAAEAANFVRTSVTDAVMVQFLPLVDEYLHQATGHDWTADAQIHPTAKLAAGMILTYWYDTPSAVGQAPISVRGTLLQLEGEAQKYRKFRFHGNDGGGGVSLPGARIGDAVVKLVGVYGLSGNQASKFEAVITVDDAIQQTDGGDHSGNQFVVVLKHPAEDVTA